jgi:hypothetical protein
VSVDYRLPPARERAHSRHLTLSRCAAVYGSSCVAVSRRFPSTLLRVVCAACSFAGLDVGHRRGQAEPREHELAHEGVIMSLVKTTCTDWMLLPEAGARYAELLHKASKCRLKYCTPCGILEDSVSFGCEPREAANPLALACGHTFSRATVQQV